MISRRGFIYGVSGALAASTIAPPLLSWAAADGASVVVPGKPGMMVRSFRYLDLEMPMSALGSHAWITTVEHFFVRNHMSGPVDIDMEEWRLEIGGEVATPLRLTLKEVESLPMHTVVNTMECAGNGRALQRPQVPGVQWEKGAVGTGKFAGVRLGDVLAKAGVKPSGKHVMFRGLDEVPDKVPPFIRSIPIEKALHADTLLVTHMNDAVLSKYHGYPLRVMVPGWIGAACCKWLTEVKVLDKEFEGNFMKPGYRFPRKELAPGEAVKPEDTDPVTALAVKSVIASHANGAKLKPGAVTVHGAAWAGEADIVKVEISSDNGTTWNAAQLGTQQAKYAWRLWSYAWKPKQRGEYTLMSRATDSLGRTQPMVAKWNPSGYLYNAVDQVRVHVEA